MPGAYSVSEPVDGVDGSELALAGLALLSAEYRSSFGIHQIDVGKTHIWDIAVWVGTVVVG